MIAGHSAASWLTFAATIFALLIVDLALTGRRTTAPTTRAAAWWCGAVILAALAFAAGVWWREGRVPAVQFTTGYLLELALSVDNLLVFILVLHYFAVPASLQPLVLKWGILGAVIMRAIVIGTGTLVLREVTWVIYALGILLVLTGLRMLVAPNDSAPDPGRNPLLRLARRILPVTADFRGTAFVVRDGRRFALTPLALVVLVIEWTDLVFAGDSIPAIFGITRDPYLVYTSNVFAIVGLRALFFVLAAALTRYVHLQTGVAIVLLLVGIKMLAARWVVVTPVVSLAGILVVLGLAIAVSARQHRRSG